MLNATCTWDNITKSRKRTMTKGYSEESWHTGRHTPNTGTSSKATLPHAWRDRCTSPVCCQLSHGADTWTLTKQAHNKLTAAQTKMERSMLNITYKDRKTNVCVRKRTNSHRYNQNCEKNEMVMGRAYQPPQRRQMDFACHHLEAIWQEKTTRETSQAVERRPGATRYGRGQHETG